MAEWVPGKSVGSLHTTLFAAKADEVGGQQGGFEVEAGSAGASLDGLA